MTLMEELKKNNCEIEESKMAYFIHANDISMPIVRKHFKFYDVYLKEEDKKSYVVILK